MDAQEIDRVLSAQLAADASAGLMAIGVELAGLYDGWVAQGASPHAVAWMGGVIERLGWWVGRLDVAADPTLLSLFPRLDDLSGLS